MNVQPPFSDSPVTVRSILPLGKGLNGERSPFTSGSSVARLDWPKDSEMMPNHSLSSRVVPEWIGPDPEAIRVQSVALRP